MELYAVQGWPTNTDQIGQVHRLLLSVISKKYICILKQSNNKVLPFNGQCYWRLLNDCCKSFILRSWLQDHAQIKTSIQLWLLVCLCSAPQNIVQSKHKADFQTKNLADNISTNPLVLSEHGTSQWSIIICKTEKRSIQWGTKVF